MRTKESEKRRLNAIRRASKAARREVTRSEINYAIELLEAPGNGYDEAESLRILMHDMPEEHARRVMKEAIHLLSGAR